MPQTFTDAGLVSAEAEVEAEFVDAAELEAMIDAELLIDDFSFDGLDIVY